MPTGTRLDPYHSYNFLVEIDGIARAYPVGVMSMHEVVNDRFGEKAYAVFW